MTERIYLTPGGARRLFKRVDAARAAYKEVCDDNPEAAQAGDSSVWHDNFAFEENQRKMHMLARQVRDLERKAAAATIMAIPKGEVLQVGLGSRVSYQLSGEDKEKMAWIAGHDDGNPAKGRISYNSPLGLALLGAKEGDLREMRVGGGFREVEVLGIEVIAEEEDLCEE